MIADLVTPDRDRLETIVALRLVRPDLPVIAMSGAAPQSTLYPGIVAKLGVRHTLVKPFTIDALLAAVDEALGHRRTA